ncbi:MAG: MFS transporter [Candidatus Pacebacteria bacterium]|nr:MFS transporter [Candidatus Paceibacterota bacterium]MBP9780572.1 MFS transporter [Candidatus Paceibacterota bacterium]
MMKKIFRTPLRVLYAGTVFFAFQTAITAYVNSTAMREYLRGSDVGIIYSSSALLTILGLYLIPHALKKFGNYKTSLFLISVSLISLTIIATIRHQSVLLFFIIYLMTNTLISYCLDIFIEHHSETETTGQTRGVYMTIINTAWVCAPLLAGVLATKYIFSVYLLAGLTTLPLLLVLIAKFSKFKDAHYDHISFRKTFVRLLNSKNLRNIFTSNFLLHFFYSWMVVFSPLYLVNELGATWTEVGIIFTIMLLPFALFEYPFGKIADKKIGEKELLILGFLIISISTVLFAFSPGASLVILTLILFLTRTGASMVEIMSETYFFKKVDESDSELISIFRYTAPLAYLVGPLTATVLLQVATYQTLFALLSIIMLTGIYFSYEIKDTK